MSASASSPTASTGESVAEGGASIPASAGGAGQPSIGGGAPRYSKRHRRRGTSRPPYRRRRGTLLRHARRDFGRQAGPRPTGEGSTGWKAGGNPGWRGWGVRIL